MEAFLVCISIGVICLVGIPVSLLLGILLLQEVVDSWEQFRSRK